MTRTRPQPRLRIAAHWYAARGLAVFPIVAGSKLPAVKDWETAATTDTDTIDKVWRGGEYNIGIAAGPSGLLIVDLDLPRTTADTPPAEWTQHRISTGLGVLRHLADRAGQQLPTTYTVSTASGGRHLYFTQPTGHQLRNNGTRPRVMRSTTSAAAAIGATRRTDRTP
jgi:hypothetical protein